VKVVGQQGGTGRRTGQRKSVLRIRELANSSWRKVLQDLREEE